MKDLIEGLTILNKYSNDYEYDNDWGGLAVVIDPFSIKISDRICLLQLGWRFGKEYIYTY